MGFYDISPPDQPQGFRLQPQTAQDDRIPPPFTAGGDVVHTPVGVVAINGQRVVNPCPFHMNQGRLALAEQQMLQGRQWDEEFFLETHGIISWIETPSTRAASSRVTS